MKFPTWRSPPSRLRAWKRPVMRPLHVIPRHGLRILRRASFPNWICCSMAVWTADACAVNRTDAAANAGDWQEAEIESILCRTITRPPWRPGGRPAGSVTLKTATYSSIFVACMFFGCYFWTLVARSRSFGLFSRRATVFSYFIAGRST